MSARKRSAPSQGESAATKKLKKMLEIDQELTDATTRLRKDIDAWEDVYQVLKQESLPLAVKIGVTMRVRTAALAKVDKKTVNPEMLASPEYRVPHHHDGLGPFTLQLLVANAANDAWDDFVAVWKRQLAYRLPPSVFCEEKGWPEDQKLHNDLLCMRPSSRTSPLPLVCLHPSFAFFVAGLSKPLSPTEDDTALALLTARRLLNEMPDSFADENLRSAAFNEITEALWGNKWNGQQPIQTSEGRFSVDFTVQGRRIFLIIRQDRLEPGERGDPLLQAAMAYLLYVHSDLVNDDNRKHGVPTFILCLSGPLLSVGGAFFNGQSCIVEPLARADLLPISINQQDMVARLLVAFKHAVDHLDAVDPIPQVMADIPHAYPSQLKLFNETLATLTVNKLLPQPHRPRRFCLYFEGTLLSANQALSVFVKMVPKNYGVEAHQALAASDLAPQLYGKCELEGAPTLYVMEYLGSDWRMLFDLPKSDSNKYESLSRSAMKRVFKILGENGLVHGDLRSNNVMVSCDENGVKLKVIDFDWSGQAGKVQYPADRNNVDITWPSACGTRIEQNHDQIMVASWWLDVFGVQW